MNFFDHQIIFEAPEKIISGSSWTGHIPFAFFLTSVLKPKIFVELGVFHGQSYTAFCQAVKSLKTGTQCFGVDTWEGDAHLGRYEDNIFNELDAYNNKQYGDFSRLMKMTFDSAVTSFEDGSIDLLHIDGLHTYEAVKHDFEIWLPKLSDSAVVLFHDTYIKDLDFGVWKFWEEISRAYPSFEFHHSCGLGVIAAGKNINRDFLEFIEQARSGNFYRKLFSSLGQVHINESRIATLNNTVHDIYSSEAWGLGALSYKILYSIMPASSIRRKIIVGSFRRFVKAGRRLARVFRIKKKNLLPEVNHYYLKYYMETLATINSMALPEKKQGKRRCAIFVMVKDEKIFLPIWLDYYARYIDGGDIYVFDHRTVDGSVEECKKKFRFNSIPLDYPFSFDHVWFKFVADTVQQKLLEHYEYVIFTDIDEIILPDPGLYSGLDEYIRKLKGRHVQCNGFDLIHLNDKEAPFDISRPVLSQRTYWYHTPWYNKTLISKQPLNWEVGFHEVKNIDSNFDKDLMLIHLHKLDFDMCWNKSLERSRLKWPQEDLDNNRGWQNRITDFDKFSEYYYGWPENMKIEEIPEELRKKEIF